VREYDLEGLPTHNVFEKDVEDLLKNHESIGWERRDYKQACAAGPGAWHGATKGNPVCSRGILSTRRRCAGGGDRTDQEEVL
jgi:hypothetical protein